MELRQRIKVLALQCLSTESRDTGSRGEVLGRANGEVLGRAAPEVLDEAGKEMLDRV
jgi:hypothetical protein